MNQAGFEGMVHFLVQLAQHFHSFFGQFHFFFYRNIQPVSLIHFFQYVHFLQFEVVTGHFAANSGHFVSGRNFSSGVQWLLHADSGQVSSLQTNFERQPGIGIENRYPVGTHNRLSGGIDHDIGNQAAGRQIGNNSRQVHLLFEIIFQINACGRTRKRRKTVTAHSRLFSSGFFDGFFGHLDIPAVFQRHFAALFQRKDHLRAAR